MRKLKLLSEKHPENIKCKDRIRKSTETMEILKVNFLKHNKIQILKNMFCLETEKSGYNEKTLTTG